MHDVHRNFAAALPRRSRRRPYVARKRDLQAASIVPVVLGLVHTLITKVLDMPRVRCTGCSE